MHWLAGLGLFYGGLGLGWFLAVSLTRANRDEECKDAWEGGWLAGAQAERERREQSEACERLLMSVKVLHQTGRSVYVGKPTLFVRRDSFTS